MTLARPMLIALALIATPVALAQNSNQSIPKPTWTPVRAAGVGRGGLNLSRNNFQSASSGGSFVGFKSIRVPLVRNGVVPGTRTAGTSRYATPIVQSFERSLASIKRASTSRVIHFTRPQSDGRTRVIATSR